MRYFVIADVDGAVALVTHDYRSGSYVCRSKIESFASVFDACVERQATKFVRESKSLILEAYSAHDHDWIDRLLKAILACNANWVIDFESESSGSDLTIDDLVEVHLIK